MRLAIFGTGAVGGYFGGRMAQAGHDVTFIARGATLTALQQRGLRVESIKGDFVIQPVQATDNPSQIGPVDVVILGVKTWQVSEVIPALQTLVGSETVIIPLQNGVEAAEQLAAAIGPQHVLVGLCRIIAAAVAPGHIRHIGAEPHLLFGEADNQQTERVLALRDLFRTAGIKTDVPSDIPAALWEKFLFVTAWGGVGAVTRAPVGVLCSLAETRLMLEQAMQEIYAVAQAHHVALPQDVVSRNMGFLANLAAVSTTSMQRDIVASRPSELEEQTGAVVRLAAAANVAVPLNRFIYHALLPQENMARGRI